MNLFALSILYFFLAGENSDALKSKYNIIKSALNFYQSRSAVLIFNGNGKEWEVEDMINFINLQKLLSFDNFYFSSSTALPAASEALRNGLRGQRETVAVLDLNENVTQFLFKAPNETVVTYYKWVLISMSGSQTLDEVTIPLNCEVIIARKDHHDSYELSETYNVDRERKLTKSLGRWLAGDQFHLNTSPDFFIRRRNLEGARIKIISPKKDACLDTSFSTGVAAIVWCIHQTVWEVIAEMLNATTEISVVPDLTRDIITSADAELTLRSAPLHATELNTRSFLWPVFKAKVDVVTSYINQKVEWRTFILPFSDEMWAVILVWIVFCDFLLTFFEIIAEGRKKENFFSLYCSEFSFSTTFVVCSQGVLGPSKFTGIKIIFVMMFIVPAVLFPGYSAVLTSFLTIQLHKKPFASLEELSREKEYKIGWHKTFPLHHMFNLEDMSPLNQALLTNNVLPEEELPETDAESVEKICKEKFVFLTVKDTILALKPKCKYYKLKQHFKVVFSSIEIKKNSWYKYFMDRWLVGSIWLRIRFAHDRSERNLDFTGTLHRIKVQAVVKYIQYNEFILNMGDLPPIKLENIVLPFAVLLLGAIASAFVLALEVLRFKLSSTKRQQRCLKRVNKTHI